MWDKTFEEVYSDARLHIPWYPTTGNHDWDTRPTLDGNIVGGNATAQLLYRQEVPELRVVTTGQMALMSNQPGIANQKSCLGPVDLSRLILHSWFLFTQWHETENCNDWYTQVKQ